ncbi:MAG: hypothetical protein Q8K67_05185 [Geothrix sp.]|nr:hypothetical protein [Geothrix sp.]
MQKVFVAQHHAEAHLVSALLHARGIAAEVRGEALFTACWKCDTAQPDSVS